MNRNQERAEFLRDQLLEKIGNTLDLLESLRGSELGQNCFLEFIRVRYQFALRILQAGGSLDNVVIAGGCRAYADSGDRM